MSTVLNFDALLDALADRIAARISAPTPAESEWMKPQQAADLIGIEVNTLEIWRMKGQGPPFHKLARNSVRYKRADVTVWMEARQRTSTSAPVRRKR